MSAWVLAAFLGVLAAGHPDPESAEQAYRAGRFEDALERYRQELSAPAAARGTVLYDMGNCAFRLGRYAEAALHYRRALLRLPRDGELRFNLRLAESRLGIADSADRPVGRTFAELATWLTPGETLALVVALQALGLAGAVLLWRRRGARALLILIALIGLSGAAHLVHDELLASPTGVILAPEIALRPDPHLALPVILELHAGEVVRALDVSDRWVRIEHPRGVGWTERAGVGIVD